MKNVYQKMFSLFLLLFALHLGAQAQNMNVKGVVVDNQSEPMIGVSILEKGTTNGTVTDFDGNFVLQVKRGATLVLSYVGYKTQEVKAASTLSIKMEEDSELLEDVVVIGYGTTKAKNFTGSVDVVKMQDSPIADMGLSSASDMLRGRMSGVILGAESGTVGQQASIQIRGQKSIKSTSENPLIILNGVIFSGQLDDIDPNSIESVSALKDATSLAAYGSKAANGVIMVTTKKGKEGKPVINFSTSQEFSTPTYTPELLDGKGYIRYRNAKVKNDDLSNTSWMTQIEQNNYAAGHETDWYDLSTRTGHTQNYNVNFSGASERANYYIGGGHSDMKGMVVGNHFMRNFLNMNVDSKITSWMKVGANINYTFQKEDSSQADLYMVTQSPYGDAKLPDGRWRKYVESGDASAINPVWDAYNGPDVDNHRNNFVLGGFISVDIPKIQGLNYRMNVSYSKISNVNRRFTHETSYPALLANDMEGLGYTNEYFSLTEANGSSQNNENTGWVIDNILSYAHQFGDHYVSASLVYTRDYNRTVSESYTGSDFSQAGNTILGWYGLGNAANKNYNSPTYSLHTDVGYLARVIYAYKDKYNFNVSFRRDGSSVFGADKKWGNFPAFGAAWTITNEDFMQNVKWLNTLKAKLSWGKNGAQTLAPYGSLTKIAVANDGGLGYYTGGNIHWGQAISTLGNPMLAWQTTTSWNGGLEFDVLNNRLHVEMNFYSSKTTDQIFDRTIPIMTAGISTQKATMGQVNNWGVEINASSVNIKKKDFTWTTDMAFTLNRNKLVELYGDGKDDPTSSLFIGKSLGAIYGYPSAGVFKDGPNAGTPIFITKDGEQTSNPSADDRTILGYSPESFRVNLGNTLKYKDFQFYVMVAGIFSGGGFGKADNTFAYQTYNTQNRSSAINVPFWTKENVDTDCPSPSYSNPGNHYAVYNNYGHIRLQDVSLSYNMAKLAKKVGLGNARVSVSGRNLLFIAPDWKRSDPQARSSYGIGLPKAVTFSLNLTL